MIWDDVRDGCKLVRMLIRMVIVMGLIGSASDCDGLIGISSHPRVCV